MHAVTKSVIKRGKGTWPVGVESVSDLPFQDPALRGRWPVTPSKRPVYTAELHRVVESHGLTLHRYADDRHIYTATPVNLSSSAVARLTRCLADVGDWMTASRLMQLNPDKTQVLWLGSKFQIERVDNRQVPVL